MCTGCISADVADYATLLIDQTAQLIIHKREVIPYESDTLTLVYDGWMAAKAAGLKESLEYLNAVAGTMESNDIMAVLDILDSRLGVSLAAGMRDDLIDLFSRSYQNGKIAGLAAAGLEGNLTLVDEQAIEWLGNYDLYWIGNYYDRMVGSNVATIISEGMQQGLGAKDVGGLLKNFFEDYPGVPVRPATYWQGMAANGMNRSRNWASISAFHDVGYEAYVWNAVLDEATTQICRELNGTVFSTGSAIAQRNRLLEATTPEQAMEIAPWVSVEDIKGKTSAELTSIGVSMPPIHFNCRSYVTPELVKSRRDYYRKYLAIYAELRERAEVVKIDRGGRRTSASAA